MRALSGRAARPRTVRQERMFGGMERRRRGAWVWGRLWVRFGSVRSGGAEASGRLLSAAGWRFG
jgi:hypothetical protein